MPSLPIGDLAEALMKRDNNALRHNLPIAHNNITTHGSNLDWAICALHGLLLLCVIAWTFKTPPRRRVFHYIAIAILTVATIYYFVMASNLGAHAVPVMFRGGDIPNRTREVFYARWIGYFINFSLIFLALLLLSGVGWATILFTIGLVMLWATMFLVGMLVRSIYKWGFFVIGYFLYFLIVWQAMGVARSYATTLNANTHTTTATAAAPKTYTNLTAYTLFLMLLYPIAWALSEGSNRITNDSEQIFYSVLDVLSQGVFAILLLSMTRTLDFDHLGLGFHEYGRIGHHYSEKREPGDTVGTTRPISSTAAGNGAYNGAGTTTAVGAR